MKFKLVYIPQGLILLLFIASISFGIYNYYDYRYVWGNEIYNPVDPYYDNVFLRFFKGPLLLFPAVIGIIIKKGIGWILLVQFFYYLLFNLIVLAPDYNEFETSDYITFIIVMMIIVGLLLILNNKKVYLGFYKIKKEKLITYNIYSFLIGLLFSYLLLIGKS